MNYNLNRSQRAQAFWSAQDWSLSTAEIARITGKGRRTVRQWRRRLNQPYHDGSEAHVPFVTTPSYEVDDTVPATKPSQRQPTSDESPPTLQMQDADPNRAHSTREFATPEQQSAIDALSHHGSVIDAAEVLRMTPWRLRWLISEAERRAVKRGWAPTFDMEHPSPPGMRMAKVTIQRAADGTVERTWARNILDGDSKLAAMIDAVQAIAEPMRGAADPVAPPTHNNSELLCVYPMGDPHFGLYAWDEETGGGNFDLETAERTLFSAVDHLVSLAPPSDDALIINLGDFFHSDNSTNRTNASGHALDVDGRFAKVQRVGARAMRRCIDRALEKHQRVHVINAIGNHDDHTSIMLSHVLDAFYDREPRVNIDMSYEHYRRFVFGSNLLAVTHGNGAKPAALPGIMAAKWAKDWGQSKNRHWYTGHIHHDTMKEYPGVTIESFRTLAARDAWHATKGYVAGRDMKLDVWHRVHGRINRHIVGVERLAA